MKSHFLSKCRLATLTLIAFISSSGWATVIEGNLEVKARADNSSSGGDLTVEGITILGDATTDTTTIKGPITAESTLTVSGTATLNGTNISGDLGVSGSLTVGGVTHAGVPVGTVIWHVGNCGTTAPAARTNCTCPIGYLKANGNSIGNDNKYATLRVLLGSNLPDLRGEFIRGWSDNRSGVDEDRVIRNNQSEFFKSHTHNHELKVGNDVDTTVDKYGLIRVAKDGEARTISGLSMDKTKGEPDLVTTPQDLNLTIEEAGGTETRPRNVALLACIKF